MTERRLGIIMNGVTGRMGTNQHLVRSICAIRAQGGVALDDTRRVMPDPILVGRSADKVAALAKANGDLRWSANLAAAPNSFADAHAGSVPFVLCGEPSPESLFGPAATAGPSCFSGRF